MNFKNLDLQFDSTIKYKIYKVDIKNRNKNIINEYFFAVVEKFYHLHQDQIPFIPYSQFEAMSKSKPIYHYVLDRGGRLEIMDNSSEKTIEHRLQVQSVNNIDLWLSETEESAVEKIKEAYEHYMNNVPHDVNIYLFTER